MYLVPPPQTPLNRHSLLALETWLEQLGAKRSSSDPSLWIWQRAQWFAEIEIGQADLIVISDKNCRKKCGEKHVQKSRTFAGKFPKYLFGKLQRRSFPNLGPAFNDGF